METFENALKSSDLSTIRRIPKADLHNHCLLGIKLEKIREISGIAVEPFRYQGNGIRDINGWITEHYAPVLRIQGMFEQLVEASFRQAQEDGVVLLEMSVDVSFGPLYGIPAGKIVETLRNVHQKVAPGITFRPCLGFPRSFSLRKLLRYFEAYAGFDYFSSIDLYDDEFAQPVGNFRELYRYARQAGLRCTAHTGEFGTAEMVREAVDTLNLDAV